MDSRVAAVLSASAPELTCAMPVDSSPAPPASAGVRRGESPGTARDDPARGRTPHRPSRAGRGHRRTPPDSSAASDGHPVAVDGVDGRGTVVRERLRTVRDGRPRCRRAARPRSGPGPGRSRGRPPGSTGRSPRSRPAGPWWRGWPRRTPAVAAPWSSWSAAVASCSSPAPPAPPRWPSGPRPRRASPYRPPGSSALSRLDAPSPPGRWSRPASGWSWPAPGRSWPGSRRSSPSWSGSC